MRKREVKMDDQAYTISPLSLSQVKEFLVSQKDALGQGKANGEPDAQKLEILWRKFLCAGLNNAGRGDSDFVEWTEQRILDELDLKFFSYLRDQLLEFSGLENEKESASPGEAKAAS